MRNAGLLIAVVVLLVAVLVIFAVFSGPKKPLQPKPADADVPDVVTLAEPVGYCPQPVPSIPHGRVQVLVDSSGSMFGLRTSVTGSLRWIEQSISRLRDSAIAVDELRLGQFDERRGIATSPTFEALAAEYSPTGRTTLHKAIEASRDYDLTFILTDGVAAAGSASGDCASGVDAACVARAFRDAVHVEQTTSVAPQPGIWIIPIWGRHSGIFFTEKPVATAEFDSTASLAKLHDELGQNVSISNARSDGEGDLVFDYTGPRGMLLIVIALSDDLGRRAVAALHDRMEENGIAAVTSVRQATAPLSVFPALELYPGYVPRVEWGTLRESEQQPMSGTLDVTFTDHRQLAIECASGRRNEGEFDLEAHHPRSSGPCVAIYQLPAFEFGFVGRNAADQAAAASFLAVEKHVAHEDTERFVLSLRCGEGETRPCASNPLPLTWMAQSRYDRWRDTPQQSGAGGNAIIDAVATTDPVTQPHRIYGLESLISIFFEEVRQDRRRVPLADLELCHGRVDSK